MLYERILKLAQAASSITTNPTLNAFELNECKLLDEKYVQDPFIKKKVDKCIGYLEDLCIDYNAKYRSAYEEYNEGITYIRISEHFHIKPVNESTTSTPDFIVNVPGSVEGNFYIELKSLSFTEGNLNYKEAQRGSLDANISIEKQLSDGKNIGFGENIISPFNIGGRSPSTRELIEIYIGKLNNNIKKGQYILGDTVLMIDIKQLLLDTSWSNAGAALYQEQQMKSIASGVLWNVAFGQQGDQIFKQIEYESASNIDSKLTRNGILIDYEYIKGLIFVAYENFQHPKFIGFYRNIDEEKPFSVFINFFCNFYNDNLNTWAYRILQGNHNLVPLIHSQKIN